MMRELLTLEERVKSPRELAGMPPKTPVLLALSGGADSRFLLHVLANMATRDGFSLVLAHVDHGIRGAEAKRDRAFCEALAKSYGLEICVCEADVPTLAAARGKGLEETAREVRYAYFSSLMKEREIPLLVTAHNADDNAETVLFRMARGSGLAGLCGIAPVRAIEGGMLVRPMLGISKRDILAYCEEQGLLYVTDSTNCDTVYARNRIRAEALPVLESLFEGASERISEMTLLLREDEAVLTRLCLDFLDTHCKEGKCPVEALLAQPTAQGHRILAAWLARERGIRPERVHTRALLQLAEAGVPHSRASLPMGVTVALEGGFLRFAETAESADYQIPFAMGETLTPVGGWRITAGETDTSLKVHSLSTTFCINLTDASGIMETEFYWRPRREGDRILLRGMHRSVRRLYREAGLTLSERATLPILCDGEGIVWVPFVGARDGVDTAPNAGGVQIVVERGAADK